MAHNYARPMAIIGGSGFEDPGFFEVRDVLTPSTPWGQPSGPIHSGQIEGYPVLVLSRHGAEHSIPPSGVNNRANLHALVSLGAGAILATSAVGSLREEIDRGHVIIPDQFIDFTRNRACTFFEDFKTEIRHQPMADPFDHDLSRRIADACRAQGIPCHEHRTLVTIEGPRFSTRAESHMFRAWGADIINMSTAPEVALANELGIPYALIAMSTDYDCWKTDEPPVRMEEVFEVFRQNIHHVKKLIRSVLLQLSLDGGHTGTQAN